ncbi:MAG: rhodanese-like domain-containing protein, partial [Chloroflexota bacterium]|nr:rhodanese-like domain-containing protein [Chloroflexota bacterium]
EEAKSQAREISAQELEQARASDSGSAVIFVDTSGDFAQGHVPGARWAPRGWLELQIEGLVPDKDTSITVSCRDGQNSVFAAATLRDMGYSSVAVLSGGMNAWRAAGLPVETGLSGVMSPPTDLVASGPDRNYADMMNYLRWETALGEKYAGA